MSVWIWPILHFLLFAGKIFPVPSLNIFCFFLLFLPTPFPVGRVMPWSDPQQQIVRQNKWVLFIIVKDTLFLQNYSRISTSELQSLEPIFPFFLSVTNHGVILYRFLVGVWALQSWVCFAPDIDSRPFHPYASRQRIVSSLFYASTPRKYWNIRRRYLA